MYGYIYLTENLINGKCYIGQHKGDKFDLKYKGSGHALKPAIEKYGWDNFVCQPIDWADSKEELDRLEEYYIDKCQAAFSDSFYNLTTKATAGWEYVNRSGHNPGWSHINSLGLANTPEAIEKRKQTLKKHFPDGVPTPDMSGDKNPMYGVHRYGEDSPYYGKHHSEESKARISSNRKGLCLGTDNPRATRVLCVETNTIYETMKDAMEDTGATKKIIKACKTGSTSGGFHWKYV